MILRSDSFYLFLIFASVVSSFVFCLGFFPYANMKEVKINETSSAKEIYVNRSIMMIIDALRLDFIESESFSYLHQLLDQKEACLLKLTVNLPTVTKPRIKVSRLLIQLIIYLFADSYLLGTNVRNNSKLSRCCHEFRQ